MDTKRIFKDALVLFAITLIAGLLLGFTNELTSPIIESAAAEKTKETYAVVYPEAASFNEPDNMAELIEISQAAIAYQDFGDVSVDGCLEALDENGNVIGYVVTATSNEGYGGAVTIIAGIDKENAEVKGIGFVTLNETAGLGMKAKEPAFMNQFPGKTATTLSVVKSGSAGDEEVQAISGATRTSKAVTGALNAAIYFVMNCLE